MSFIAASLTNSLIVPAHLLTPRTLTSLNRVRKCPDQLQLGGRRMGIMGTYTAVAWSWSQANAMSESPFHWKWRCSAKTTCSILLHTARLVLVPSFCNHYIETSWFFGMIVSSWQGRATAEQKIKNFIYLWVKDHFWTVFIFQTLQKLRSSDTLTQ